jgi:hypothetical protein
MQCWHVDCGLLASRAVQSSMWLPTFHRHVPPPSAGLKSPSRCSSCYSMSKIHLIGPSMYACHGFLNNGTESPTAGTHCCATTEPQITFMQEWSNTTVGSCGIALVQKLQTYHWASSTLSSTLIHKTKKITARSKNCITPVLNKLHYQHVLQVNDLKLKALQKHFVRCSYRNIMSIKSSFYGNYIARYEKINVKHKTEFDTVSSLQHMNPDRNTDH